MKKFSIDELREAFLELKFRYREERGVFMTEDAHREAYLQYRSPATSRVLSFVLEECGRRFPQSITSLMDVGAGPGTSKSVLQKAFPLLKRMVFLEKDRAFGGEGEWIYEDARDYKFDTKMDLFLFSYVLNELSLEECFPILQKSFSQTEKILIIIEPGSKAGFQRILEYRNYLIGQGGYVVAPCPHQGSCPLDWCHFSVRVERSSLHRQIKEGTLSYEDEKFCYLIVAKEPVPSPTARVVDKVESKSKMVTLPLCTKEGFVKKIFTKRKHAHFSLLKKARWGDAIDAL